MNAASYDLRVMRLPIKDSIKNQTVLPIRLLNPLPTTHYFPLLLHFQKKETTMKKLFSTKYSDRSISLALLLLRLSLGGLMIPHGYKKLMNFAAKSSSFADPFHIGGPASMGLAIFAEFFCAVFIVLGLMTRLATIPLIVAMSVAVFIAHKGEIFGEGEHAALYLFGFIVLLFTGPGKISMDKLIGK
jgi:putative oxidoreductase